jgi:hypothetical protein
MDDLVESLLLAVLRERGKPLYDMRSEVRIHIDNYERFVRDATVPDQDNPDKHERAVQAYRDRFRERVEREALQTNRGTADHLHHVLKVLDRDRTAERAHLPIE